MGKTTEIVKAQDYAIVAEGNAERRQELIKANMGPEGVSQFDLDRAKIPAGGGLQFELPTLDGVENLDSIDGVIIGMMDVRLYWVTSFEESGGGSPPDCFSAGGLLGLGNPGGGCAECPYAQFGSAAKGGGQACSQRRLLLIARPTGWPIVLSLPPTSLANCRKYFLRLIGVNRAKHEVVTSIGLEKTKSAGGITYSRVIFSRAADLPDEMIEQFRQVAVDFNLAGQSAEKLQEMAAGDGGAPF